MNTKTCKIVCFGDSTTAEGFSPFREEPTSKLYKL